MPVTRIPAHVREALISRRRTLGLNQRELAETMGTAQSAVCDLENARHEPRFDTLTRWAEALGMRVSIAVELAVEVTS